MDDPISSNMYIYSTTDDVGTTLLLRYTSELPFDEEDTVTFRVQLNTIEGTEELIDYTYKIPRLSSVIGTNILTVSIPVEGYFPEPNTSLSYTLERVAHIKDIYTLDIVETKVINYFGSLRLTGSKYIVGNQFAFDRLTPSIPVKSTVVCGNCNSDTNVPNDDGNFDVSDIVDTLLSIGCCDDTICSGSNTGGGGTSDIDDGQLWMP